MQDPVCRTRWEEPVCRSQPEGAEGGSAPSSGEFWCRRTATHPVGLGLGRTSGVFTSSLQDMYGWIRPKITMEMR